MIKAIIAWGIGFGGVHYLPTMGFVSPPAPDSSHSIYRLDQPASGADMYRGSTGGSADIYRTDQPATGGKMYR